jgi:hypothetical protein
LTLSDPSWQFLGDPTDPPLRNFQGYEKKPESLMHVGHAGLPTEMDARQQQRVVAVIVHCPRFFQSRSLCNNHFGCCRCCRFFRIHDATSSFSFGQ